MASLIVRDLSDEVHRALKARAARHSRSTEAEVRSILASAVEDEMNIALGSEIMAVGQELHGVDVDIVRESTPHQALDLS